jgi:hypothetical protein
MIRKLFNFAADSRGLLILVHILSSWAVSLSYILVELSPWHGRFSIVRVDIVRWSLEFVFAPLWVFMYWVLVPIDFVRHLPRLPPPGFLTRFLPFGMVYVLTFVLTFRRLRARQIIQKRIASGQCCRNCHYDLRSSPERCPECGTPVPQKSEAAA